MHALRAELAEHLKKISLGCSKKEKTDSRPVSISVKLSCYSRLIRSGYDPLKNGDKKLIKSVKKWCKQRNKLVHGMVSLENYNEADKQFENLATEGIDLVKRMYEMSGYVREYYYDTEKMPQIEEAIIEKCDRQYKCI